MVSPSCIPYSTIEMPDIEMSPDEVSDEVLEDSDDEPIVKIKVSDSVDSSAKDTDTTDIGLPPSLGTQGVVLREGSNFAAASVGDPASSATSFFIRFDQDELNEFCPIDFWGTRGPYVDFLGYLMPQDYVYLLAIF